MRTLKTIVVALGVLLVVGFGVLVFGMTQSWHRVAVPAPTAAGPAAPAAAPAALPNWGRVVVGMAPDAHIQSVTPAGRVIVVQIVSGNDERLLVLDPTNGAVVGIFALGERP
ncbi:MAG TPA: hypothetical protein VGB82_14440 [Alphaproteobacteria bacterium]